MKKIVLYATLIIAAVFYIAQTSFAESSIFDTNGFVFSGKEVQENLYKASDGETIQTVEVKAQDKIYRKGSSFYVGEKTKQQVNFTFPMYINDGAAVKLMDGGETLITSDFEEVSSYEGLIIDDGVAFNTDLERADWNDYILIRLSNGLYVNSGDIQIKTFLHEKSIASNSICYFTTEYIRYYYYDNGIFKSGAIEDIDLTSIIRIRDMELTYYDFLLSLGEIDVEKEENDTINDENIAPEEDETDDEHEKSNDSNKGGDIYAEQGESADGNIDKEPKQPEEPERPSVPGKVDDVGEVEPSAPAEKPQTPASPEKPAAPSSPDGSEDLEVKYPDWKLPVVTNGDTFTPGVYTLKTQVKIDDPAGVIVGGITYEICINEGNDIGKVYKRVAVVGGDGNFNDVYISGLQPDYNYTIKGYFKYKDKYGRVQSETVTFLEPVEFKTKELSELGTIKLEDFNLSKANFYSNKIELPNLKFAADSDIDAVGSLSQVVIRFTAEGETKKNATILSSANLENLKNMKSIYFVSNSDLKSNTEYEIDVVCYDRFSNALEVEGSHTVSKTCKNLPKATLTIDYPDTMSISFKVSLTNSDNIEYKNLVLVVKDTYGNVVKINGDDHLDIEPGKEVTLDSLGNNKSYVAYIYCDCDINDGKGERTQQLLTKAFTTSSLEKLGALSLTAVNRTKEYVEGDSYHRAVIGVKINEKLTNDLLPPFVSVFTLTLSNDNESFSVSLTDEELARFINGEEIIFDTDNFTQGLSSNSAYKVTFTAKANINDELVDIKTSSSLYTIKTSRQPVEIEMKNVQAYTGFIEADIRISDIDDVIEGNTAILQIRKEKGTSTVLVGAFRIEKNATDFYQVRMYADSTVSSDGKSYEIEGGQTYIFRFIAEEANTDGGLKTNYVLFEKEIKTDVGVTGKVFLKSLQPVAGSDNKYDAEMLVTINDSNEWLASKTCYVDVYRKIGTNESFLQTIELKYEGTGTGSTPLSFSFEADGSSSENNKYVFDLYIKPNDNITIPLSSVDFSTEEPIYTISSGKQFASLGTSDKKYVVICDIEYTNTNTSYTQGPWGQTAFNGKVDFQGFSFDLTGNNVFMWQLNKNGSISNMILKNHNNFSEKVFNNSTGGKGDAGVFLYKNYGTLSNIKVEYDETEFPFTASSYWSDTAEHFAIAQDTSNSSYDSYRYNYPTYNSALVSFNYNLIENFVVEFKTPMTTAYNSGGVVRENSGTIRNGYVYGSDPEQDYKAQLVVYSNKGGVGAYSNKDTGAVSGRNMAGAVIENVFALCNVVEMRDQITYTAIIVGSNRGQTSNSYSVGDVTYNGTVKSASGPSVVNYSSGTASNIYFISDYSYNTTGNLYASLIALKNIMWQENLLNKNTRNVKGFNVESMVDVNCYPQVVYTSEVMPVQDNIPLPDVIKSSAVDLLFSDTYVSDPSNELNDKLLPYIEGNEAWDDPDENGKTCQTQVAVLQISDKSARDVYSVDIENLKTEVLATYKDGTGITTVYLKLSDPTACLSQYTCSSVTFLDYAGNPGTTYSFSDRYVNVSYFWRVSNPKGSVDSWSKVNQKPTENFTLTEDLDFSECTVKDVFVSKAYSGTIKGNGYELRNIEYTENLSQYIGETWVGLFYQLKGTITDLTLRNFNFEGGGFAAGLLAADAVNANIENVYIIDGYITGGAHVGGMIGRAEQTSVICCGVSNVKIVNTFSTATDTVECGGLIGLVSGGGVNISRSFAQNVYIESMGMSHSRACSGGLVGELKGSNNSLNGCYVTGIMEVCADAAGGLVGFYNSSNSNMESLYSDVDIFSYNGSAGGLVGRAVYSMEGITGAYMGNISSGSILEEDDVRRDTFSMICMDSARISGGYYDGAIMTLDDTGTNYAAQMAGGSNSFSYDDYADGEIFKYIDPQYFVMENNDMLPKLTDNEGNLLPNQTDEYIDAERAVNVESVTVTDKGDDTYDIKIVITHNAGQYVEKVYTDYTYVDSYLGLEGQNLFNSFTKHTALASSTKYVRSGTSTTIEMTDVKAQSYYDFYYLTGIVVKENGQSLTIRVNEPLGIAQQFGKIASIDDWKAKVYGSHCENFMITADIDFSDEKLTYHDEKTVNNIINRLVGSKGTADDYSKGAEEEPYYAIKNVVLEPGSNNYTNVHKGWLYRNTNGFIRSIVSECSNVAFKNISINRTANKLGVIGTATGKISGVIFKECSVKTTNSGNNYTGMIGLSVGMTEKIYSKDCSVYGANYIGGVIGLLESRKYNTGASYITVDSVTVTSIKGYAAGGMIGYVYQQEVDLNQTGTDVSEKNGTQVSHCKVSDSVINKNSGNDAGGIIGKAEYCYISYCTASNITLSARQNYNGGIVGELNNYSKIYSCNISDSYIKSTAGYVGGIVGLQNRYTPTISDSYVYNCKIEGDQRVGGIVGDGEVYRNNYVEDCTVIAKRYAGGISGYITYNIHGNLGNLAMISPDVDANLVAGWVINTRIYAQQEVGGAVGAATMDTGNYIVTDCEVRGSRLVGGIVGNDWGRIIIQSYCYNTLITTLTQDIASEYSLTPEAEGNYFGGIAGRVRNGAVRHCMVDNCIIGDSSCNYTGGVIGELLQITANNSTYFCISQNSVVIGNTYVGGLIGRGAPYSYSATRTRLIAHSASNCLVVGSSRVGGIIGEMHSGDTSTNSSGATLYPPMPYIEQTYFSGAIRGNSYVSGIAGYINTADKSKVNACLSAVISVPEYIRSSGDAEPVVGAGSYYGWENLIQSTSALYISLWDGTEVTSSDGTTTMKELLAQDKYKDYVSTRNAVNGRSVGGPFIFTYAGYDDLKTYAYTWGLKGTGWLADGKSKDLMPLVRSYGVSGNPVIYNGSSLTNVLANPFTNETHSLTMTQGMHIPGSEAYNDEIDAMEDMYDAFINGGGVNTLNGSLNGYSTMSLRLDDTEDLSSGINVYASDVDKVNVELDADLLEMIGKDASVTVSYLTGSGELLLDNVDLNKESYTVKYNFIDSINVEISYEDDEENIQTIERTFNSTDLCRRIMLYNGEGYYFTEDGLFGVSLSKLLKTGDFVNIYNGKVMDSGGDIWDVKTLEGLGNISAGSESAETLPLYTFSYNGKMIRTYGTYSAIYENETEYKISADMRLYEKNGELIAVKNNVNAVYDGIFAYLKDGDSYIVLLKNDGELISLGTVPVLDRLSGFTNGGIKSIASNINSSETLLLIEKYDGSILGFDIITGEEILRTEATDTMSVTDYMLDFIASTFSLRSNDYAQSKKNSDELIQIMEQSNLSLDEILAAAEDILIENDKLTVDEVGEMLAELDGAGEDADNAAESSENRDDAENSLSSISNSGDLNNLSSSNGESSENISSEDIPSVQIDSKTEDTNENGTLFPDYDSVVTSVTGQKNKYISVYDSDKGSFDIYETSKLLSNPAQAVSETEKIADKTQLKAMYKALAESGEDDSLRGIVMYCIIILAIVAIFINIIVFRKKQKKQED